MESLSQKGGIPNISYADSSNRKIPQEEIQT